MLTATQLGITNLELTALGTVREGLASGKYRHVEYASRDGIENTGEPVFNMGTAYHQYDCGQVGCIGGWTAMVLGKTPEQANDYVYSKESYYDEDTDEHIEDAPIYKLFFPRGNMESITPTQAVQAIDNFRNFANPLWESILSEEQAAA